MRWIKAAAALIALLALAIAPPLLLVAFVGSPVPAGVTTGSQLDDNGLIKLLTLIVWLLWAQTLWCMVAETIATARSSHLTAVRGTFGIQQQIVRIMIGAIIAAVVAIPTASTLTTAVAAAPQPTPNETSTLTTSAIAHQASGAPLKHTTATRASQTAATATAQPMKVDVRRGDSLWSIADTHLGDGERWNDIAALNEGRTMADGRIFHGSDPIRPGWTLLVPATADADGRSPSAEEATEYTVKSGDTLSQIALEETGNASNWPQLFDASRTLHQPTPLIDPDLIYPGQHINIPNTDTRTSSPPKANEPSGEAPARRTAEASPPPRADQHHYGPEVPADHESDAPRIGAPSPQSTSSPQQTHDDTADRQLPGWVTKGLLGAGTLLAGSLLLTLRSRKARQHRSRRPGRVPAPNPDLTTSEKSITVAGASTTNLIEFIDTLLKRLAATLTSQASTLPALAAIEITDNAVALHLREPAAARPAAPWAASHDGLLWVIDKDVDLNDLGPDLPDAPAPWPLLVTIGHDNHGGTWLLNLEDLDAQIAGDTSAIDDFLRFAAAEVACNPWSRQTTVDLVGVATEISAISPERIHVHDLPNPPTADVITDAVHTIDRLTAYLTDTPTARARQDDPDTWPSRLMIIASHNLDADHAHSDLEHLIRLIDEHAGTTSTALLRHTPDGATGFAIQIDERAQLTIPAVNLMLTAVGLSADEAQGCAALLAAADRDEADAPTPDLDGPQAWQKLSTTTGSLRDQYRVDRSAVTLEPATSLLDDEDDTYTNVAATAPEDLQALAPQITTSVREQIINADPTLDDDLEAWHSGTTGRPRLSLLGPVGARTSGRALDRRKPFYTELFAYLATRPYGATTDEVATAFDITAARVRIDINKLRDWLGTDRTTGDRYLPDARHAPSAQQRGVGVYEVVNALIDINLFRRLRIRGEARGAEGIDDLLTALQLVNGRPFDKLRPAGWAWLLEGDRLDEHLLCAIVDVAHIVITHALHEGDLDLARTAVDIATSAAPDEEITRLDHAAVLEAQGHHAAAARLIRDDICNRSDDEGAPAELSARTESIIDTHDWLRRKAM